MLPMKEVSRICEKPETPSGRVLNVAVLIADVKITLASRVLGDTGKLQSQVAELNGVSLRYVLDVPLSEFIGTGASLRQDDIVTPLVEVLGLLDDLTIGRSLDLFRAWRRWWWRIAYDLARRRPAPFDRRGNTGLGQHRGARRLRLHGRRRRRRRLCGLLGRSGRG